MPPPAYSVDAEEGYREVASEAQPALPSEKDRVMGRMQEELRGDAEADGALGRGALAEIVSEMEGERLLAGGE